MRAPLSPILAAVALATAIPAQFDWSRGSREHAGSRYGAHLGESAAWGDFDGDGMLDYALGEPGADRIRIFRGIDGFPLATLTGLAGSRMGTDIDAADFDGDGRDDLVAVSGRQFNHALQVWLAANWSAPAATITLPSAGEYRFAVAAWDHDDDGSPSIVVGSPDRSTTQPNVGWIGLYDLAGTLQGDVFGATRYGYLGEFLTVGDLDGDDRDELFATESGFNIGSGRIAEFERTLALPPVAEFRSPTFTLAMGSGGVEVFETADGRDARLLVGVPSDGPNSEGAIAVFGRDRVLRAWLVGPAADDRLGESVAFDRDGAILVTTANTLQGRSEIYREHLGALQLLHRETSEALSVRGGSFPSRRAQPTTLATHQVLVSRPYASTPNGAYAGVVRLIPALTGAVVSTTTNGIDIRYGGRFHWDVHVGASRAGAAFWPFLSLTGPGPLRVTTFDVWLTPDPLTSIGSIAPGAVADAAGLFAVEFVVPANALTIGATGRSVYFGGVGVDTAGRFFGLPSHHAVHLF